MKGMGSVTVTTTQDCRSRSWKINWIDGGNKEQINVLVLKSFIG